MTLIGSIMGGFFLGISLDLIFKLIFEKSLQTNS